MPIHGYPGNVITANPTAPTVSSASGVWTTEQQLINQSAGRWPMAATQISRSLRFNSADSAYLNRTPASASNRKTWTWSGWVKISNPAATSALLFTQYTDANTYFNFGFNAGALFVQMRVSNANAFVHDTDALYRDASAWYHIVYVLDTTQATDSNRAKLYVNGTQVTLTQFTTNTQWPALNTDYNVNTATSHRIGYDQPNAVYFNGYMTEINFIDGLALDPSYFGFNNSDTGVWSPKQYTGTYGTNGFYLNFSDNSNTTAATLGKDSSGNGNNWTPNNFSVTAGVGNDSLVDSPTAYGTDTGVGGTVRGNYATLNPLVSTDSGLTYANGNLNVSGGSGSLSTRATISTIVVTSGKWYSEINVGTTNNGAYVGIVRPTNLGVSRDICWNYFDNLIYPSGSAFSGTATSGDIIGIAYDADAGTVQFYKNGSTIGSLQTGATVGVEYGFYVEMGSGGQVQDWNFGQRAFAYTAPSGFKALCTQNLPTPTIGATSTTQANDYFNTVLWTGDSTTSRGITGVGFQPDLTWLKSRSLAASHGLYDAVRGVEKWLGSNSTSAEVTQRENGYLSAFGADGFTLAKGSSTDPTFTGWYETNQSGQTYVAWNWKANGAGVSNTAGDIASTVSVNQTAGFSIVSFAFPAVATKTVGHGLGVAPQMVIVKSRSSGTEGWVVYHVGIGNTSFVLLNSTNASAATITVWNNTSPTSSVFTLGSGFTSANYGANGIAYCFAPVAGYSAFGSYVGNGSTDGPFVYLGFRPEFIMTRSTSGSREWYMYDAARDTYNVATNYLRANTSAAEGSFTSYDMVSNGFKLRSSDTAFNGSGETYIYMAFAEFPFKFSLAR